MHPHLRSLIPAVALVVGIAPNATAQGSQHLLEEVMVLTPYTLRDLVDVAETGDTVAQFKVGLAYYYGYAVEAMPDQAARWFRRAAEHDCVAAQHMLGVQLRDGNGVDQDTGEALRWLRAAVERGYPDAQYDYALMLFDGIGVEQNYVEAYTLFSRAAAQGSVGAQTFVGLMLVNGLGVDPNPTEGREALLSAATAGSPMAQANLGALYAGGVGVEQSATEALIWFYMAEAGGFDGVGALIADMTQSMTESDVTELRREAQQRAERFLEGAAGQTQLEEETPQRDEAETLAELRALSEWLVPELTDLGTFFVQIRSDVTREIPLLGQQSATVRGRNTRSEVSLDGCRLHYVDVTQLGPETPAVRWEWFINLGDVDPAQLRVEPWELPEGWRAVSGDPHVVYLRGSGHRPDGYFIAVDPDGQTGYTWELNIPIRNHASAEEVAAKLHEGIQLCAAR